MSTEANVLAIGPYSHRISDSLEYDKSRYSTVPEGTEIATELAHVYTRSGAEELAEAFGVKLDRPETYLINEKKTNWLHVHEALKRSANEDDIQHLIALHKAGLKLFFRLHS
jgi:hypothetical protein